jgi:hypothetical protein
MKTTVLAMILACIVSAGAQAGAQSQTPSQTQPSAGGAGQAAPEIKDPNEYNAYVAAIQQKDPTAKVSALEAFLTQYPNSVMKTTAYEVLMASYLQINNPTKGVETAKRLVAVDACNIRALAILTSLSKQGVQGGQAAQLADLTQYSDKGLECVKSAPKPATVASEADWETLKKQVTPIFEGGKGFACLQNKDYACAQTNLKAVVDADPNDLQNVYPLAMSYLTATPPDTEKGLCYIGRAANLAQGPAQAQIQKYGLSVYKNYHGSDEGWNGVLFATKSSPFQCPSITKYIPPTDAQRAHDVVNGKTPEQIKQLSFGEWELVLSAGTPEDQEKVWSVIKGVPLQMEGNVVSVRDVGDGASKTTEVQIAASSDDIEKNQADITLTMTGVISGRLVPKPGDTLDFEGVPVDYVSAVHQSSSSTPAAGAGPGAVAASPDTAAQGNTPGTPAAPAATAPAQGTAPAAAGAAPAAGAPQTPFMMTMEKGKLLQKAGTTPKKPAARHPTTRKPQR